MIISTRAAQLCPSPLRNKNVGYKDSAVGRHKIILLGHKPKKVGGLRVDRAETPENCLEKG